MEHGNLLLRENENSHRFMMNRYRSMDQAVFRLNSNRPIYFGRFLKVVHELGISWKWWRGQPFTRQFARPFGRNSGERIEKGIDVRISVRYNNRTQGKEVLPLSSENYCKDENHILIQDTDTDKIYYNNP